MANPEHLKLLEQGVDIWNEERPYEVDLSKWNFMNANLSEIDLSRANLTQANFNYADLSRAKLVRANLTEAKLGKTKLSEAILIQANLSKALLAGADLSNANLMQANLIEANLFSANLYKADLSEANLNKVLLIRASLIQTKLIKADLSQGDIGVADFSLADLREANLREADLTRSDLSDANLSGANLTQANLMATQALTSNFENTNLTGACIEDWNIKINTNFKNVICNYIYLGALKKENDKLIFTKRCPSNPNENFAPGDFAHLIKKAKEAVDLILHDGIQYFDIQSLEQKNTSTEQINNQNYTDLEKKIEQMNNKLDIIKNQHINTIMQANGNIYNLHGPTGIAHNSGEIKDQVKIAGVLNEAQQNNLNMIKVEIDQILQPLLEKYPTEQDLVDQLAVGQIAQQPNLMKKLKNAVKEGGLAALEQLLNHPIYSGIINAVKGWQEA